MQKLAMLVVITGALALSSGGCSSPAPEEPQGSTSSHLDDEPNIVDGNYVETYDDEAIASERANDMRSVGLTVDQEGTLLRVHPTEGAGVVDMVDSASSEYLTARWGGGGASVQYASKLLNLQSAGIHPQGLSIKPVGLPVDLAVGGNVHVTGNLTATPDMKLRASSCGHGCINIGGHAGLAIDATVGVEVDGSVKIGRDIQELGGEILLGTTVFVVPTPIPIPVTVSFYLAASIACEGELKGKMSVSASAGGSANLDFWTTIDKQRGLDSGGSAQLETHGDLDGSASLDKVTFACGLPEVRVIARIYELGGPFVSFGPKLALSSTDGGPLHSKLTFDTGIGVEAKRLGFDSIKHDGPSIDLRERDF